MLFFPYGPFLRPVRTGSVYRALEKPTTVPSALPLVAYGTAYHAADVATSQSLTTFKKRLKTFLFKQSHH